MASICAKACTSEYLHGRRIENISPAALFATASDKPIDRIVGIETGADDYLVKPYVLRELLARIKGLLRRMGERKDRTKVASATAQELTFAGYRLDMARRTLKRDETLIALTGAEFDLLAALAKRAGRVLSRAQIADLIGSESDNARAVDTAVTRLRKKIEIDPA